MELDTKRPDSTGKSSSTYEHSHKMSADASSNAEAADAKKAESANHEVKRDGASPESDKDKSAAEVGTSIRDGDSTKNDVSDAASGDSVVPSVSEPAADTTEKPCEAEAERDPAAMSTSTTEQDGKIDMNPTSVSARVLTPANSSSSAPVEDGQDGSDNGTSPLASAPASATASGPASNESGGASLLNSATAQGNGSKSTTTSSTTNTEANAYSANGAAPSPSPVAPSSEANANPNAGSAPAESAPAGFAPTESALAESTPAESAPAESAPAESAPAESAPQVLPLRRGKWTKSETAYAYRLIHDFKAGILPIPDGVLLRAFLAEKLHCEPMRITKKYARDKCIGKVTYRAAPPYMFPLHLRAIAQQETEDLRRAWLVQEHQKIRARLSGDRRTGAKAADFSLPPLPAALSLDPPEGLMSVGATAAVGGAVTSAAALQALQNPADQLLLQPQQGQTLDLNMPWQVQQVQQLQLAQLANLSQMRQQGRLLQANAATSAAAASLLGQASPQQFVQNQGTAAEDELAQLQLHMQTHIDDMQSLPAQQVHAQHHFQQQFQQQQQEQQHQQMQQRVQEVQQQVQQQMQQQVQQQMQQVQQVQQVQQQVQQQMQQHMQQQMQQQMRQQAQQQSPQQQVQPHPQQSQQQAQAQARAQTQYSSPSVQLTQHPTLAAHHNSNITQQLQQIQQAQSKIRELKQLQQGLAVAQNPMLPAQQMNAQQIAQQLQQIQRARLQLQLNRSGTVGAFSSGQPGSLQSQLNVPDRPDSKRSLQIAFPETSASTAAAPKKPRTA